MCDHCWEESVCVTTIGRKMCGRSIRGKLVITTRREASRHSIRGGWTVTTWRKKCGCPRLAGRSVGDHDRQEEVWVTTTGRRMGNHNGVGGYSLQGKRRVDDHCQGLGGWIITKA